MKSADLSNNSHKLTLSSLIESGRFIVQKRAEGIYLTRSFSGKAITIVLEKTPEGYWIKPPKYTFHCKNSYFEFCEEEQRWSRDKSILLRLVAMLKEYDIWMHIVNKNFFEVNENNRNLDLEKATSTFHSIMSSRIKKKVK